MNQNALRNNKGLNKASSNKVSTPSNEINNHNSHSLKRASSGLNADGVNLHNNKNASNNSQQHLLDENHNNKQGEKNVTISTVHPLKPTPEQMRLANLLSSKSDDPEINKKIKQVEELVTDKDQDVIILALHENDYDVSRTVNFFFEGGDLSQDWKTVGLNKKKQHVSPNQTVLEDDIDNNESSYMKNPREINRNSNSRPKDKNNKAGNNGQASNKNKINHKKYYDSSTYVNNIDLKAYKNDVVQLDDKLGELEISKNDDFKTRRSINNSEYNNNEKSETFKAVNNYNNKRINYSNEKNNIGNSKGILVGENNGRVNRYNQTYNPKKSTTDNGFKRFSKNNNETRNIRLKDEDNLDSNLQLNKNESSNVVSSETNCTAINEIKVNVYLNNSNNNNLNENSNSDAVFTESSNKLNSEINSLNKQVSFIKNDNLRDIGTWSNNQTINKNSKVNKRFNNGSSIKNTEDYENEEEWQGDLTKTQIFTASNQKKDESNLSNQRNNNNDTQPQIQKQFENDFPIGHFNAEEATQKIKKAVGIVTSNTEEKSSSNDAQLNKDIKQQTQKNLKIGSIKPPPPSTKIPKSAVIMPGGSSNSNSFNLDVQFGVDLDSHLPDFKQKQQQQQRKKDINSEKQTTATLVQTNKSQPPTSSKPASADSPTTQMQSKLSTAGTTASQSQSRPQPPPPSQIPPPSFSKVNSNTPAAANNITGTSQNNKNAQTTNNLLNEKLDHLNSLSNDMSNTDNSIVVASTTTSMSGVQLPTNKLANPIIKNALSQDANLTTISNNTVNNLINNNKNTSSNALGNSLSHQSVQQQQVGSFDNLQKKINHDQQHFIDSTKQKANQQHHSYIQQSNNNTPNNNTSNNNKPQPQRNQQQFNINQLANTTIESNLLQRENQSSSNTSTNNNQQQHYNQNNNQKDVSMNNTQNIGYSQLLNSVSPQNVPISSSATSSMNKSNPSSTGGGISISQLQQLNQNNPNNTSNTNNGVLNTINAAVLASTNSKQQQSTMPPPPGVNIVNPNSQFLMSLPFVLPYDGQQNFPYFDPTQIDTSIMQMYNHLANVPPPGVGASGTSATPGSQYPISDNKFNRNESNSTPQLNANAAAAVAQLSQQQQQQHQQQQPINLIPNLSNFPFFFHNYYPNMFMSMPNGPQANPQQFQNKLQATYNFTNNAVGSSGGGGNGISSGYDDQSKGDYNNSYQPQNQLKTSSNLNNVVSDIGNTVGAFQKNNIVDKSNAGYHTPPPNYTNSLLSQQTQQQQHPNLSGGTVPPPAQYTYITSMIGTPGANMVHSGIQQENLNTRNVGNNVNKQLSKTNFQNSSWS